MYGAGYSAEASVKRISAAAQAAPAGGSGGIIEKLASRGPVVPFGAGGIICCVSVLASS